MVVVPIFSLSGSLAVFIRSKVVKGHTYYQIVEGVRTGPKVRQRIVLALGTSPDPRATLEKMEETSETAPEAAGAAPPAQGTRRPRRSRTGAARHPGW
jgi:hypothetical protein